MGLLPGLPLSGRLCVRDASASVMPGEPSALRLTHPPCTCVPRLPIPRSAELTKLTQQHGAEYVVTEADVRAATAAAMQSAMRGLS